MATVGAVLRTGATPVLVDVDAATWTMSPDQVARAVTPRTKAILPVHLYGNPADVPAIAAAAPGIPIVEDAAQAHGARYHGRAVGSDSAAASYSFYPGKDARRLRRRRRRHHRRPRARPAPAAAARPRPRSARSTSTCRWGRTPACPRSRRRCCGRSCRTCRSGSRRQRLAAGATRSGFAPRDASSGSSPGPSTPGTSSAPAPTATDRLAELRERGISTGVHYPIPVHRQPGMAGAPHRVQGGELRVTDELAATCLSLPIYPELGEVDMRRVLDLLLLRSGCPPRAARSSSDPPIATARHAPGAYEHRGTN